MEKTREELKGALALLGPRGRGKPYPKQLLEQLVAYSVARRREGANLLTIGAELGVSWRTLGRWISERAARAGFRRVQVVSSPPARQVVVHGPGGLRIEGLDVAAVAELVRRVGE